MMVTRMVIMIEDQINETIKKKRESKNNNSQQVVLKQ